MTRKIDLDHEERIIPYEPYRGSHEMTLQEAAQVMGITKQRANDLEMAALFKLWNGVWSDPSLMAMWEEIFK
jgi:DNA-directed RNA polymerase sigma subunit (sigma70/sigma32)